MNVSEETKPSVPSPLSNRGITRHRGNGNRPGTKPTIADVARAANVSVATVSYVLNNRSSEVSPATAARVQQAVRNLGYVKNLAAASLSGKKSRLIAVIIPDIYRHRLSPDDTEINPFYGEFIFRLEDEARARGYALCVHGGPEKDYVSFLIERNVDMAVLVGVPEPKLPAALDREGIHCVLYDAFEEDTRHSHVRTNEMKGGYLAAERLIDIGRRKLVFVGAVQSGLTHDVNSIRYRGARKACEMAEIDPIEIIETKTSFEEGVKAAEQIAGMKADGVAAAADIIAAGLLEGLQGRGLRVPEDVAVMGYDNLPISRLVRPRLTTIDQGLSEKVRAVMAMIHGREENLVKIVDPHLVLRESA